MGMCVGLFARSLADLSALCTHYGIQLQIHMLFNESLIPRARNYCADEFMRSDCEHFMFIDADIGFNPHDVIAMMAMQYTDPNYHVICGPYPKKCISWEKIVQAVNMGKADEDPNNLEKYVGDYVFNPKSDQREIPIGQPVKVLEGGTGFMMISREAFEKFQAAFPERMYRPDHVRTEAFDGSREIMMFFQSEQEMYSPEKKYQKLLEEMAEGKSFAPEEIKAIIEETAELKKNSSNRYLSEDYLFCYMAQKIGLNVWLCPWMSMRHVGTYVFSGSLADLASIGASATADSTKLGKKKKA